MKKNINPIKEEIKRSKRIFNQKELNKQQIKQAQRMGILEKTDQ